MSFGKKTYVITALCMIAAGLIYLMLPLSKDYESFQKSEEGITDAPAELSGEVLYRIEKDWIETSKGRYTMSHEAEWIANGQPIVTGISRFLGENITISNDAEGKIVRVETGKDLSLPQRVRVILAENAAKEDYIHAKVAVTCQQAFWSIQDGMICAHPPGAEIGTEKLGYRTIFYTAQEGDTLTLISAKGTTAYKGKLEVTKEDGGYSIVNEVALETYLKGVVPAEMPGSYGEEAAKVQAICARSFACCQWLSNDKFAEWGAQLDDSTRSQVYGGVIQHEASEKGVDATWGQILTYNDQPIATHFFSTSCGHTANAGEVWGGTAQPYEQGAIQYTEGDYGPLSEETEFHAFITDAAVKAFDSHSPWFRWTILLTQDELQALVDIYFAAAKQVKVVNGLAMEEAQIDGIGQLQDMFVYERSSTGMVLSVILVGSENTVVVETPMEIRNLLGGVSVVLANGESAGSRDLLPSAFFSLEKIKDTEEKLVSVQVCGGGYGHGVGLSQNGVKGMVDAGYNYKQILNHYFPNTVLQNL